MKKVITLLMCAIMLFSLVACSNQTTTGETLEGNKDDSLTMRQKRILMMQGLSTDYDKLTEDQRKAIEEIEELLCYAEDKYGYSCEYIGYTNEFSENGVLTCTTSEGSAAGYEFYVYRDQETIKDTYIYAECTPVYTAQVEEYLKQNFPDITAKVYPVIFGTGNMTLPVTAEQLNKNINAECCVLIDSKTCDKDRMQEIVEAMKAWQTENAYAGITQVSLMAEGIAEQLTRYNYAAYLDNEHELLKETYDIPFAENE